MCCVSLVSERGGASVDHFDIVERVEMGQMASMFFNKGEVSMPTLTAGRLKRNSFDFPLAPPCKKSFLCFKSQTLFCQSHVVAFLHVIFVFENKITSASKKQNISAGCVS